jgi:hypothetical protein
MLTSLLKSLRARILGSPSARGRHGSPAGRFRLGVEPLDQRWLLSATPVVPLAALTLEPGHLAVLRAFQGAHHLGTLYAALPDLGAGVTVAASNTFVGSVSGTNLLVGVVLGPREALAYICDGHNISDWFRGKVHGPTLTLPGENGGRIVAQVQGDLVSGALTLHNGRTLGFTASRAENDTSGLFRSVAQLGRQEGVLSLIRLRDKERGAVFGNRGSRVCFIDPLSDL